MHERILSARKTLEYGKRWVTDLGAIPVPGDKFAAIMGNDEHSALEAIEDLNDAAWAAYGPPARRIRNKVA